MSGQLLSTQVLGDVDKAVTKAVAAPPEPAAEPAEGVLLMATTPPSSRRSAGPAAAVELANRTWRKRILPVGDVQYNGRTLHFTEDYLGKLEQAFRNWRV